jgi:hypothetical protein
MLQLDQLRPEHFEPLIGQSMPVESPGGTLACELTQVKRLPLHALRAHPPFALILRGPLNQPLSQGTYPLLHPEHGRLNLFMVPIGPDGAGLGYEITFN